VVFTLVLCCGGCATAHRDATVTDDADTEHDPAEPVNRAIFKANVAADHAVMKPVAQAYSDHVPEGVQKGIHNVVQNLKEPAGEPATNPSVATGGANVVHTLPQHAPDLDELERTSLDYYATPPSDNRQHPDAEISAAKERQPPEGQVDISVPTTRP